jgi:hypothetical protein
VTKNVYTFYRQGQGVTINAEDPSEFKQERVTTQDMGDMYLLFDEALITRSSSSILFFKIHHETGLWTLYHQFDEMRG